MAGTLDKFKLHWNSMFDDYLKAHSDSCAGRKAEAWKVMQLLRYNALMRLLFHVPVLRPPGRMEPSVFQITLGALLEGQPGCGRSFFVDSLSRTHPSRAYVTRWVPQLRTLRRPCVTVGRLLCVELNFNLALDDAPNAATHLVWTTSTNPSYAQSTRVSLPESLMDVHNRLVDALTRDASAESIVNSVLAAGFMLDTLYKRTVEVVQRTAYEQGVHYFDALLTCTGEHVDLMRSFVFLGGVPLWVSVVGYSHVGAKKQEDPLSPTVRTSRRRILTDMINNLVDSCQRWKLPIFFFRFNNTRCYGDLAGSTRCEPGAEDRRLDTDILDKGDTGGIELWSALESRLLKITFSFPLSLETRREVLEYLLRKKRFQQLSTPCSAILTTLAEYTFDCDIPRLCRIVEDVVYQCVLRTLRNTPRFPSTYDAITEKDMYEVMKRLPRVNSGIMYNVDMRTKCSCCVPRRPAEHWVSLTTNDDSCVWASLKARLVDPFFATEQRGWPTSLCAIHGTTGTGKTHLGYCLADACDVPMIRVLPSDVMKPHLGDSEKRLIAIFDAAYHCSPCIIGFEAPETWCATQTSWTETCQRVTSVVARLTAELLRQIDHLRLHYITMHHQPSPILVLMMVTTTPDRPNPLHPTFYGAHRTVMEIHLPCDTYWTPQHLATLFVSRYPQRVALCSEAQQRYGSVSEALGVLFSQQHCVDGPGFVQRLVHAVTRLRLRQAITEVNGHAQGPEVSRTVCDSPCTCVCAIQFGLTTLSETGCSP